MVTVIDHPLVQHKLTLLRRKETTTGEFRRLCRDHVEGGRGKEDQIRLPARGA